MSTDLYPLSAVFLRLRPVNHGGDSLSFPPDFLEGIISGSQTCQSLRRLFILLTANILGADFRLQHRWTGRERVWLSFFRSRVVTYPPLHPSGTQQLIPLTAQISNKSVTGSSTQSCTFIRSEERYCLAGKSSALFSPSRELTTGSTASPLPLYPLPSGSGSRAKRPPSLGLDWQCIFEWIISCDLGFLSPSDVAVGVGCSS